MPDYILNVRLRAWRNENYRSRAQMAERINDTPLGSVEHLICDVERVRRRWESGEVKWAHTFGAPRDHALRVRLLRARAANR